jgi:hypothetical protein
VEGAEFSGWPFHLLDHCGAHCDAVVAVTGGRVHAPSPKGAQH